MKKPFVFSFYQPSKAKKRLFCLLLVLFAAAFLAALTLRRPPEETERPSASFAPTFAGTVDTVPAPATSARAYALLDAKSGALLAAGSEHTRLGMASTTKIMTALVVLEHRKLSDPVTVNAAAVGTEGSSLYLRAGETLTVENLLTGLLLASANDAAAAFAYEIAGGIDAFAGLMNEKAAALGLADTHFVNPHGLSAEGHYTTAADLARLAAFALENDDFRRICATRSAVVGSADGSSRFLRNHNRLLWQYPGAIGVKTGYTVACGRCLVSAAEREGNRFVAVTLDDRDDWRDHTKLLNYAFDTFTTFPVADASFRFRFAGKTFAPPSPVFVTVRKGETPTLDYTIAFQKDRAAVTFRSGGAKLGTFYLEETADTCKTVRPSDRNVTVPSSSVR